jgi:hypothetical protein
MLLWHLPFGLASGVLLAESVLVALAHMLAEALV